MNRILTITILTIVLSSCSNSLPVEGHGYPLSQMGQKLIPYRADLPARGYVSLDQLIRTVPVFEGEPEPVQSKFGPSYSNRGRTWILEGDGAQISVRADRLSPDKVWPHRLRVTLGPAAIYAPDELWVYILEDTGQGWRRVSAHTKPVEQDAVDNP